MRQDRDLTDKFVIKNASLRPNDYIFFICVLILLYYIFEGQHSEFIVLVFLGLLGFTTYRIVKRLRDRSDKIIIDTNGIRLCETNNFIDWSNVNYAYIKQKSEGFGKRARVVDYFHIDTKDGEIIVRMSDLSYKQDLLKKAIESFSGRNIGEMTDLINDKVKKIIDNDRNIDWISELFTDFYKRQNNLVLIVLLPLIGILIYLQVIIDFPYIFAIGFTLTLGFIFILGALEEKRLRRQKYICELDDKEFKTIKKEYGQGYELEMSKGKSIAMIIFLSLFTVGIFVISYVLSN